MKKKLSNIAGLTLIEILIAIVISSLMMIAMFTSYTIVNSTYRQVTDRAKISQAGRDLVGQILREVRMAGFKYLNDDIAANDSHVPIKITTGTGLPIKALVFSLNALQNSIILIPLWPNAGPTGGAGFA